MKPELMIYRCSVCGNIVTLLRDGGGELVCCGEPMKLLVAGENETAAKEKHIPVVTKDGEVITVSVGSVLHPMTEEHHIEFVLLVANGRIGVRFLSPGDTPVVKISGCDFDDYEIYAYCNLHGLWKA
jgi:superoxide reductase